MCETNANPIYHRHLLGIISISPNAANETVPADDGPRRETKNNKDPKFRCLWYSMISWSQTFAILPPPLFHGSLRQEAKTSVARRHNLFRRMLWRAPFVPDPTVLEKVYEARDPTIWGVVFAPRTQELKYQRIWINCIGFGADVRIFTNKFRTTPDFQTDWQSLMNTND